MTSFQTKFPSSFNCATDFVKSECKTSHTFLLNFTSLAYQPALVSLNLDFCHPVYADLTQGLEGSVRMFSDILETVIKCHGDNLPKIVDINQIFRNILIPL